MIDVSELMNDADFARDFIRRRPTGSLATEGVYTPAYSDATLTGPVQPAGANDLRMLPEGTRSDEILAFWCKEEIRIGDGKNFESDIFVVDGASYRAIKAEPWGGNGYFKALGQRFQP